MLPQHHCASVAKSDVSLKMKPSAQKKPPATGTDQSEDPGNGKESPRRCRKRVVVVVITILTVALVGVAGGLTAAYTILKERQPISERVYTVSLDGTDVSVKMAADPKANISILTDGTTTIVREYNKGFTVHATPAKDGEVTCFIRLMDKTTTNFSTIQEFVDSSAAAPDSKAISTVDRIVGEKIKDVTFLSNYAQKACYGHDAYWVAPDESKSFGITKRSSCCICLTQYYFPPRCFCYCYIKPKLPIIPNPGPLINQNQLAIDQSLIQPGK